MAVLLIWHFNPPWQVFQSDALVHYGSSASLTPSEYFSLLWEFCLSDTLWQFCHSDSSEHLSPLAVLPVWHLLNALVHCGNSAGLTSLRPSEHFNLQREAWWLSGRHGGTVVACLTVVLQSRVQIWHLPSPQLTANCLVGCHLRWHLAARWPLWGATEEKIMRNELLVHQ